MHYLWLQFFFRDLVEGGKLAALGYKMPDIPESGGQQDAPRGNEPDSPNLPGEAEPLEEIEDDEEDEPTSDELTQATEIARETSGELIEAAKRQALEIDQAGQSALQMASSMNEVSEK